MNPNASSAAMTSAYATLGIVGDYLVKCTCAGVANLSASAIAVTAAIDVYSLTSRSLLKKAALSTTLSGLATRAGYGFIGSTGSNTFWYLKSLTAGLSLCYGVISTDGSMTETVVMSAIVSSNCAGCRMTRVSDSIILFGYFTTTTSSVYRIHTLNGTSHSYNSYTITDDRDSAEGFGNEMCLPLSSTMAILGRRANISGYV